MYCQPSLRLTHPARGATGMEGESKAFFSEEKKQKTFTNSGVGAAG
jgi:hypothetical protein